MTNNIVMGGGLGLIDLFIEAGYIIDDGWNVEINTYSEDVCGS